MRLLGTRARGTLIALGVLALVTAGGALALQKPGRTVVRAGQIRLVALNNASLAFMVSRTRTDCDHVELWDTNRKGVWRFGRPGRCTNLGSTGTGISALGVSGNRVLWIRYTGGNLRDWQLMTATTTRKTPRQLKFVEQDVGLPSPFTIGDSTRGLGIPYATGKEIVLLNVNGAAAFRYVDSSAIVRVTAGRGPGGAVVAALRETGNVVTLRANGTVAKVYPYAAGQVRALALAPGGLVVQLSSSIEIHAPGGVETANLPGGAVMLDYVEGRILYGLGDEIHSFKVSNGTDTRLLKGTAGRAVFATQDTHGLGWAEGSRLMFACGSCVSYTP